MSDKNVDQAEVDRFNREGRLHPSQWRNVLEFYFWFAVVLFVAGFYALVRMPGYQQGYGYVFAVPVIVIMLVLLVFCVRRLLFLRKGTITTFTGFTHDAALSRPLPKNYPILLYTIKSQGGNPMHTVAFNGLRRQIDHDVHAKFRPEHENTIYLTPNGKVIVNVIPS
ncbi:hypothetical protein ACQPXB_34510 [Amycolatopsis sp. CA-161197]|uniref:hypothetical protein n=1 Tax=Amycolatopsis sp. CA-161197 TaxID=3239922 RepID=UPI003D8A8489